ncbi:hypothetical protein MTO96_034980 [Rhipicephalus appendiculatus]
MEALLVPSLGIQHLSRDHVLLYQDLLEMKRRSLEDEKRLGVEDIQTVIDTANQVAVEASNIGSDDAATVEAYMRELRVVFLEKRAPFAFTPIEWFAYLVRPGLFFNLNVVQFRSEWSSTPKADHTSFLSLDDVRAVVLRVNEHLEEARIVAQLSPLVVRLQARARGFLIRSAVRDQYSFYCQHLDDIVLLQSWFRAVRQRRRYRRMLYELEALVPFVVRLQCYARGFLARKKVLELHEYYKDRDEVVTFVQTRYRSHRALRDYQLLTRQTPTVPVLQRFLHMLDISEHDLGLEKEVFQMDIRIGLLVRNCITLEDVMSHRAKKRDTALAAVKSDWLHSSGGGLTALSRRSRQRLEAYQHLFYLLQVDPHYLAKLIFVIPPAMANNFVESVIYSVYNYGSTPRDEYLLLRLFRFALQEEVRSKLEKPSDILRGNPLVVRMVVGFFRTRGGHNCLELLLSPLVKGVLDDRELKIDLNPVDIYKKWVNDMETTSGKPSGLKYDVTEEEALQHNEVYKMLHNSVAQLENKSKLFARTIAESKSKIPYGMLYLCKVLKKALEEKFPESTGEEITKVIGNILYYRYLNPGHRGSRVILSSATSGAPYRQKHAYQIRLNNLIESCREILHRFFMDACEVSEPEDRFNVDSYSEATYITPPTITLTALELRSTHRLLLEHEDDIAPDPKDPMHGLLQDLGPEPTLEDLVGGTSSADTMDVGVLSAAKVSLSLYGKFSEEEEDVPETDQLLRDTKYMLVELLKVFRHARTVDEILHEEVSPELERAFLEAQAVVRMPKALLRNLDILEGRGITTAKDDYQALMSGIASDILQKRNHRVNRKRELANLADTQRKLDVKTRYYEETLDYYQRYVDACLANLSAGKSRRQSFGPGGAAQSAGDVQHLKPLK